MRISESERKAFAQAMRELVDSSGEDCEGYRVKGTFNYCPKCGAEVVSDAS